MKSATENTKKSASVMVDIDYDAISKNSAKNKLNSNFPVYDDDIFDGLPGLKSKSMSSSGLPSFEENVFGKSSQQSDDFDEFLGSLSRKQKGESIKDDSSKSLSGSDDLIPGFGSGNAAFNNRSSSEPTSKSTANTKETSNAMDDPFVVLESTSSTTDAYQSFSTDPPEEIGNISKSGTSQNRGSSVSGSLFEDIDPLNGFGNSVPAFTSETNNREKDQSPLKEGSGMGWAQSSVSKDSTQKASFRYSESRLPVSDFQESHRTVFDIPEVSRSHNRSFNQSTSSPSCIETSSRMGHRADEIWLTVSEIPLFTQPTRTPPPSRPPPPVPRHISKPERVSLRSNSRKVVNGFSSPKFATSRIPNDSGDYADDQSAEERDSTLAAAAMKEAMDRAEAKFRHAKEVRERENSKASRNKERMQSNKNEHREKEEEEREKRRLEKERIREVERQKARQSVERAIREARERAAFEAREKASVEARLKSERDAVQRAQAEARERAAVGARDRAERAATEAKQKAEEDVRRKAERAAVERVAFEARKRAAVDARERAVASRMNQQKNGNDLESFFSNSSRGSPRPRETSSDSTSDPLSQNRPDGAHMTSTAGVSSNLRRASSTTNIVDDLSSIFGAAPTSGHFQEVEGETEERRRARLEREQRTQERTTKALAEKNQRDLQSQREQEERHRFGGTLDTEVKRWAAGKEGNLRALLSTLQYILWPESGWQPVSLTDLITGANVKKTYRKATLCIHPDKVQQKGANLQQKYVAEKVFDILKEAWNKFNSEELF